MASIRQLEEDINKIKARNKKVEADKAWETSWFRRILVFVLTYIIVVIFFIFAEIQKPFLNAVVPALAFVLSTLTMPFFKKFWMMYIK
jgi:uncharacterized membrane-anchored protein